MDKLLFILVTAWTYYTPCKVYVDAKREGEVHPIGDYLIAAWTVVCLGSIFIVINYY